MKKSNQEIINLSNQIQIEFPSIKSLVVSFKKTSRYKAPSKAKSSTELDVFNRLLKLLEPIDDEITTLAKNLGAERNELIAQAAAEIKIANAVVTAAELPPGDGEGSPKFELRF